MRPGASTIVLAKDVNGSSPRQPHETAGRPDSVAPLERVPQAFFETDERPVAEQRARLRDVRLRILDVAGRAGL